MDAILISWDPRPGEVEEVRKYLDGHEYYWRVKFRFSGKGNFGFPAFGYIQMKRGQSRTQNNHSEHHSVFAGALRFRGARLTGVLDSEMEGKPR
jgi:hypothetical protein